MILLTSEEIITLNDKLIERTGGTHGLRDKSLLESAVYSAVSSF
jgi:death-on-curing protein